MKSQNTKSAFDQELLNRGNLNELFYLDTDDNSFYDLEGEVDQFDEMNFSDFMKVVGEEEKPVYFKSVPDENTGSQLLPLGA